MDAKIIEVRRLIRPGKDIAFLADKDKRKDEYPLLSAETFRAWADFILDQSIWTIDTNDLFDGCVIFVRSKQLSDFYNYVLPAINKRVIVVSMGDEPDGKLTWEGFYNSKDKNVYLKMASHPKVLAFFAKNFIYKHPTASCLPLGRDFFRPQNFKPLKEVAMKLTKEMYFQEKPIKVYLNFSKRTFHSRPVRYNHWKNQPGVEVQNWKSFEEYMEDVVNSRFVISPRGYGLDCFRTWEALYAGSIPVIESSPIDSVYEGLPVIILKDLSTATVKDIEREYEKLKEKELKLERLFADYWFEKIKSYR